MYHLLFLCLLFVSSFAIAGQGSYHHYRINQYEQSGNIYYDSVAARIILRDCNFEFTDSSQTEQCSTAPYLITDTGLVSIEFYSIEVANVTALPALNGSFPAYLGDFVDGDDERLASIKNKMPKPKGSPYNVLAYYNELKTFGSTYKVGLFVDTVDQETYPNWEQFHYYKKKDLIIRIVDSNGKVSSKSFRKGRKASLPTSMMCR